MMVRHAEDDENVRRDPLGGIPLLVVHQEVAAHEHVRVAPVAAAQGRRAVHHHLELPSVLSHGLAVRTGVERVLHLAGRWAAQGDRQ